jgi:hypothetical protein
VLRISASIYQTVGTCQKFCTKKGSSPLLAIVEVGLFADEAASSEREKAVPKNSKD